MEIIFVNLKRFEVSTELGGICPVPDPIKWIKSVIQKTIDLGLTEIEGLELVYLLPEALLR